jgi:purine-cytosine permease-like protein
MEEKQIGWKPYAEMNHRQYYSIGARIKHKLDRLDDWWHSHPVLAWTAGTIVVVGGIIAAVNLGLNRPWF